MVTISFYLKIIFTVCVCILIAIYERFEGNEPLSFSRDLQQLFTEHFIDIGHYAIAYSVQCT